MKISTDPRAHRALFTGVDFRRLDPKAKKADFLATALVGLAVLLVACGVSFIFFRDNLWVWLACALLAVAVIWLLALIPFQYRNFGYAETDEEFIIKSGALFYKVEVIPYGRLQKVELSQGPFMRIFALTSLQIVTASAGTDGSIAGLSLPEAERLRRVLLERSHAAFEGV